jgi:hypothetical protein
VKREADVSRIVLRVSKRRTSWESRNVDEIVQTEFKTRDGVIDTEPSVYVLEAESEQTLRSDVVRVVAEHAASFLNDPPKGAKHVDLQGLANTARTPGTSRFTFANARHHELAVGDVDALRGVIERAIADIDQRFHPVDRDELIAYAAARIDADDPEWASALTDRDRWRMLIAKRAG